MGESRGCGSEGNVVIDSEGMGNHPRGAGGGREGSVGRGGWPRGMGTTGGLMQRLGNACV